MILSTTSDMKEPQTIKGYISLIRKIDKIPVSHLKGFDELSKEQQKCLLALTAELANSLGEFDNIQG